MTLTSVGYGDIYPYTSGGHAIGFLAAISGVLIVAVPLAIVARKLAEVYDQERYNEKARKDPRQEALNQRRTDLTGSVSSHVVQEDPMSKMGLRHHRKYLNRMPKSAKLIDGSWGDQTLVRDLNRMQFQDQGVRIFSSS